MHCFAPGDHGDHGTSVSDEIDLKMKVGQNIRFFSRESDSRDSVVS